MCLLQNEQMFGNGAAHGVKSYALIEGYQGTAMFYRQREQIQISDWIVAVHAVDIDSGIVAQCGIVRPERMIEGRAGVDQLPANALQAERAASCVAGQVQHTNHAVFHQRACRDGDARDFDQRIGLQGGDVRIVKPGNPYIYIQQQTAPGCTLRVAREVARMGFARCGGSSHRYVPSRSINSRTCSTVTTSSRHRFDV